MNILSFYSLKRHKVPGHLTSGELSPHYVHQCSTNDCIRQIVVSLLNQSQQHVIFLSNYCHLLIAFKIESLALINSHWRCLRYSTSYFNQRSILNWHRFIHGLRQFLPFWIFRQIVVLAQTSAAQLHFGWNFERKSSLTIIFSYRINKNGEKMIESVRYIEIL